MHISNQLKMRSKTRILRLKKRGWIIPALILVAQSESLRAQCAMCRAVVEQGGEEVAEGINSGIVYLMAFPYIIVAVASYLLYRNWRRTSSTA
jgi:ribosomal protein L39E